jgi:D-3-phosphoglycerate dehydrogenase
MIPSLDRFQPFLEKQGLELIVVPVQERLEEHEILQYAGQYDGTISGDDKYTARVPKPAPR